MVSSQTYLFSLALKFYTIPSCVHENSKMVSVCKSELEMFKVAVDI